MVKKAAEDDLGTETTLRAKEIFCLVLSFEGETSSTSCLDLLEVILEKKRLDLGGIRGDENQREWLRALEFLEAEGFECFKRREEERL